jgi:hypothetical protein
MPADELNGWITVASVLIAMGMDVAHDLKAIFTAGDLSDDEQATILAALADDNARRRAISAAIAGIA